MSRTMEHDVEMPLQRPPLPDREAADSMSTARAAKLLAGSLLSDVARVSSRLPGRFVLKFFKWMAALAILMVFTAGTAMLWVLYQVPLTDRSGLEGSSVIVEAANGTSLGRVGPLNDKARAADFPATLRQAVISIEDRRFYSHWGFDPWGIIRAARSNWEAGAVVEGGSTIAQQLVKMQLVGNERTLDRKLREVLTAAWLELRLGKDEILTRYLNSVYLGAGAYGMSAAARIYFDKRLPDLSLAEAAMLAGLIQAPSRYDPLRNLEAARGRAGLVLDAMLETGAIDAQAAAAAKAAPATPKPSSEVARSGSWFADWIAKSELPKIVGSQKQTMRVRSTLEPEVQRLAEQAITQALSRDGGKLGVTQAALVAMRPDGSVIAMVGGRDYDESQFNRAADGQRQSGSTFKLFVYYAALLNGFSPETTIDASSITIGKWTPENFGGHQYGRMPLSEAFAKSVNTAAVRLATNVGLGNVTAAARELGLAASLREVPSMALGSNELTLLDLTRAFASVRAGRKLEPWGIAAFGPEGGSTRTLGAPAVKGQRLLRQNDAMVRLLREVVARGTGRNAAQGLAEGVAGKTGTTQDHRDAWFIGFNDDVVAGVWVGNDDRTPMKDVTGGSLPAQIWGRFVGAATPILRSKADLETAPQNTISEAAPEAQAALQCNVQACAARYSSFRAADCTYQPFGRGRRRACDLSPEVAGVRAQRAPSADNSETGQGEVSGREERSREERRRLRTGPSEPTMALRGAEERRQQVDEPRPPSGGGLFPFLNFDRGF